MYEWWILILPFQHFKVVDQYGVAVLLSNTATRLTRQSLSNTAPQIRELTTCVFGTIRGSYAYDYLDQPYD